MAAKIIQNSFYKKLLILLSVCVLIQRLNAKYTVNDKIRRKVLFSKSSKVFFRLNGKEPLIPETSIFAHGWTVRVNYDLPDSIPKRHKFFKRNVLNELAHIRDRPEAQGFSCVLKYICELAWRVQSEPCDFLCQIGSIIRRSEGVEADFFKDLLQNCDHHINACPFSFENTFSFDTC